MELQLLDFSYFRGKSHFKDDDIQNYLTSSQSINVLNIGDSNHVSAWTSKGLSNRSNEPLATFNKSTKLLVKFDGYCLKQDKATFTHKQVINIHTA